MLIFACVFISCPFVSWRFETRSSENLPADTIFAVAVSQKSNLEVSLEESRAELLALRTDRADTVKDLEAQVDQLLFLDNTMRS